MVSQYSLNLEVSHPNPYTEGWQTSPTWDVLPTNLPPLPQHKFLERILLPALEHSLRPVDSNHGFRKMRSTVSGLLQLTEKVKVGFN